jgi:hypothetical protein
MHCCSWHLGVAMLSHLFELSTASWGATSKVQQISSPAPNALQEQKAHIHP